MSVAIAPVAEPTTEKRIPMAYAEFLAWGEDTTHAEWVDGEVIIFMPPKIYHQNLVSFLTTLLRSFVDFLDLGHVLTAPSEMRVYPDGRAREPDILFVATENSHRLEENRLTGPADLIVEVISTESVARDRTEKFYEYQEAGVREYWLIDPRPGRERADFWVLDEKGQYQPVPLKNGVYRSTLLTGFWLRADWLAQNPLPDSMACFAEIIGLPTDLLDKLRNNLRQNIE